ncbi:MAG: two-component regulator propeller domain-containing protein [Saprospiraceae bacterium]
MYFANDKGLMQYDGTNWTIHPFPNKTILRSIEISNDKIYVGGQNEFGYFKNIDGVFKYVDLRPKIKKRHREFEDVWQIVCHNNYVYFRSSDQIYSFHGDSCYVIQETNKIEYIGVLGNKVVYQDTNNKLYQLNGFESKTIDKSDNIYIPSLIEILNLSNKKSLFLSTKGEMVLHTDEKFTKWDNDQTSALKNNNVISAFLASNQNILIGTRTNGLYIYDKKGKLLNRINKDNGLLSNSIRCIFEDKSHNIWIGSDKGINLLLTSSDLSRLYSANKLNEAGYCSVVSNSKLYLGTSDGLFVDNWPIINGLSNLTKNINSNGQVWNLKEFNNQVLLFHHSGLYNITDDNYNKVSPQYGNWLCADTESNNYFCGTYDGIELYEQQNNQVEYVGKIDSFTESSRFIVEENRNTHWISHPYKGIYQITKDGQSYNVNRFGKQNGLPSNLSNYVFKIRDEVIFGTNEGIYIYKDKQFVPHSTYNQIFDGNESILRLVEGANNTIWFVTGKAVGFLKINEKGLSKTIDINYIPELKDQMIGGFESINSINDSNVIIGIQNGFLHYNPANKNNYDYTYSVVINSVLNSNENKIVHTGYLYDTISSNNKTSVFDYLQNSFVFNYSATSYDYPLKTQYSTYLEGVENGWSDWKTTTLKEYTNLNNGTYIFNVKAKNIHGKESVPAKYIFTINPPWYKSFIAYCIYSLGFIALIYLWYFYFDAQISEHKEKSILSEAEISRLEKEKLKLEIEHKNRELLSSSMHMAHKNEVLSEVVTILNKFKGQVNDSTLKSALQKVNKIMRIEQQSDSVWTQFVTHFNEVHPSFFEKLKSKYPVLSQKDLKLCAYLKMNLSTKELASMLNMSIRGVEGARYRLRKKIGISSEHSLTDFLYQFSAK